MQKLDRDRQIDLAGREIQRADEVEALEKQRSCHREIIGMRLCGAWCCMRGAPGGSDAPAGIVGRGDHLAPGEVEVLCHSPRQEKAFHDDVADLSDRDAMAGLRGQRMDLAQTLDLIEEFVGEQRERHCSTSSWSPRP